MRVAQCSTKSEIRGHSAHTDNCYTLRNEIVNLSLECCSSFINHISCNRVFDLNEA